MFLELKNNERIKILNTTSYIEDLIYIADSEQDALNILQKITPESVETVSFLQDDGTVYFEADHMKINKQPYLEYEVDEATGEKTGKIRVIITIKMMTDLEREIYDLKESQSIQDLAIDDLAAAISSIVEGE